LRIWSASWLDAPLHTLPSIALLQDVPAIVLEADDVDMSVWAVLCSDTTLRTIAKLHRQRKYVRAFVGLDQPVLLTESSTPSGALPLNHPAAALLFASWQVSCRPRAKAESGRQGTAWVRGGGVACLPA
jgi:hypothetical protein